jgi:probable HAF family extracellular repeat protein
MRRFIALVLVSLLLGGPRLALAVPRYTFTTLDVPGSNARVIAFTGINNTGQIVGSFSDARGVHGFVWRDGHYTILDGHGSSSTSATGINDAGQIVGTFTDANYRSHGFVWRDGQFTPLDVPGSSSTSASQINDAGQIVGTFRDAWGPHGFLATPVAEPGDLDHDGDVDQEDLTLLLRDLNTPVTASACGAPYDLDGDGPITALDARKLQLLCTRPRCATP